MSERLTDWFGYETPPEHIGVYEVKLGIECDGQPLKAAKDQVSLWFAYWKEDRFMCASASIEGAYENRHSAETVGIRAAEWRGLAERPE